MRPRSFHSALLEIIKKGRIKLKKQQQNHQKNGYFSVIFGLSRIKKNRHFGGLASFRGYFGAALSVFCRLTPQWAEKGNIISVGVLLKDRNFLQPQDGSCGDQKMIFFNDVSFLNSEHLYGKSCMQQHQYHRFNRILTRKTIFKMLLLAGVLVLWLTHVHALCDAIGGGHLGDFRGGPKLLF